MVATRKLNFTTISTSLLLSIVALPVSVTAFAVSYLSHEPIWSVLWMLAVLPAIWAFVVAFSIRDALKHRSWRQIGGSILLLAPTVLLAILMLTPRYALHQLFTFRPLDFHLPTNGFAFAHKFQVCPQQTNCTPHSTVSETKTFKLTKLPDGCCLLLAVPNDSIGKRRVEAVHIVLNGEEVNLQSNGVEQIAEVKLSKENDVTVQLTGTADAYVWLAIHYTGKKIDLARDAPSVP
jgi:hypothetical protein